VSASRNSEARARHRPPIQFLQAIGEFGNVLTSRKTGIWLRSDSTLEMPTRKKWSVTFTASADNGAGRACSKRELLRVPASAISRPKPRQNNPTGKSPKPVQPVRKKYSA
jgi:hypothetical protein